MSEMDEKAEEPQEQPSEQVPIPPEKLHKILKAHRKWVESKGKEGERASLFGADLHGAILEGANLQEADLSEADLQGASLSGAKGLTASRVKAAKNWEMAFYNERVMKKLAELEKEKKGTGAK